MIILLLLLALVFPSFAWSTTYYVATNGSGSTCSFGSPCGTIAVGVGKLSAGAGDILYLRGGTYNDTIGYPGPIPPSGTTFSNAATIAGYPGEVAIVQRVNVNTSAHHIIFQNLVIDNVNGPGDSAIVVIYDPSPGSGVPGDNYLRFVDVEGKNWNANTSAGAIIFSNHNEFTRVKMHDNISVPGETRSHGYYINGSFNTVSDGEIYNCTGYGVQIFNGYVGGETAAHDNVVSGNRIHNNGSGGVNPGGIILSHGANNIAYNNLVYGQLVGGSGIDSDYSASNTQIYNNTIYSNNGNGMNIGPGSTNAVIKNNIIFSNGGIPVNDHGVSTIQSNNLTTDPSFVDASLNNFHLQVTSVAINAGVTLLEVPTDISGILRPQGSAYDIGAYEFVSSQPKSQRVVRNSSGG